MKKKFLFIPLLAFTLAACGKNPAPAPTEGILHFHDGIHENVTWNGEYETSISGDHEAGCVCYYRGEGSGMYATRAFKQVRAVYMTIKELEGQEFAWVSCYLTETPSNWSDERRKFDAQWDEWTWEGGQSTHVFDFSETEFEADKTYYISCWLAGGGTGTHWQVLDLKITFALE